jgi:hypothetical protein
MFYPVCAAVLWWWAGSPVVGNPAVDLGDHRPVQGKPYLHEIGGH